MAEHARRQRDAGRHQEGRPIDGMEADDVLADDMHIRRPVALELRRLLIGEADAGEVIGQRVDPHIHNVLRVARHRDAPIEGGARDRQILQAAAHEALHLVRTRVRADELRMRLVMGKKPVLIGRQPEEIALLLDPLDRRPLRRQLLPVCGLLQLALVVIGLVPHRVPAGIFVEIDVAILLHAPPQLFAGALVPLLRACE